MPIKYSDSYLVQSLIHGDVEAFNNLYKRYHKPIYANIIKIVKSEYHAQDILQEVFVTLWQNRFKMNAARSVGGWLFVVSYNKSVSFLKRKVLESLEFVDTYNNHEQVVPDEEFDEVMFSNQLAIIEEAVNALSTSKKTVFKMCRYEGKSKEEVAVMMGISPESVKDYLKQSNKSIKKYIMMKYPYDTLGVSTFVIFQMMDLM